MCVSVCKLRNTTLFGYDLNSKQIKLYHLIYVLFIVYLLYIYLLQQKQNCFLRRKQKAHHPSKKQKRPRSSQGTSCIKKKCVLILLYISYQNICVPKLLYIVFLNMCPHTAVCRIPKHVSSYYHISKIKSTAQKKSRRRCQGGRLGRQGSLKKNRGV